MVTLDPINKGSGVVLSNNNMTVMIPNASNTTRATVGKTSGKWYWEVTFDALNNAMVSVINSAAGTASTYSGVNSRGYYSATGTKWAGSGAQAYGELYVTGDTIGVSLDMDNGTITFYKNGASQGVAFINVKTLGEVFPAVTSGSSSGGNTTTFNFGDKPFKYLPSDLPSGTKAYNGNRVDLIEGVLLFKNNKGYSTHIEDTWYETNMTSNNAPAPLVASASSTQSTTYAPWKAFDGVILPLDNQSSWSATSTLRSGWLQLDYGAIIPINKISLTVLEYTTTPKDFQILGSNDNTNWTTLLDVKEEAWTQGISNETKEYHLPETANNRYYRINISTVSAPNKQPMITELKYGYERKELTEISKIDKDAFVKYGKESFDNLDSDFKTKIYVLNDTINNTASKQLHKKPLSIRFD